MLNSSCRDIAHTCYSTIMFTSLQRRTWTRFRTALGIFFWPLLAITVISSIFMLSIGSLFGIAVPWFLILLGYAFFYQLVRRDFWREFAAQRGWSYTAKGSPAGEHAAMFKLGHSRRIRHLVSGTVGERSVRIFEYAYTTGSGDNKTTHYYTVHGLRFAGSLPHLYLNNKKSGTTMRIGTTLPVPNEFAKRFELRGPAQYEIEALEIFTPDIFAYVLALQFPFDVELVEHELLVFTSGLVDSRQELEQEAAVAHTLMQKLSAKLDTASFEPIGTHSHRL